MSEQDAGGAAGPGTTRDARDVERPDVTFPSITTPTRPKRHARPHRGVDVLPSSSFESGRFGRMYRHLPVFELSDTSLLKDISDRMVRERVPGQAPSASSTPPPPVENPSIPSGYTYLGQFIDHDITFDPVSSLQRQNDPDALHNFRTPRYDLDSVYGRGPGDQPYLYDGPKLRLGESVGAGSTGPAAGLDLPRTLPRVDAQGNPNFRGKALIGDPRNDENLIVSQLHATMLRFHNAVVDHVRDTAPALAVSADNLFKEAQRLVRWHYQWVVVHDFLPRIAGAEVVADVLPEVTYTVMGKDGPQPVAIPRPRMHFYRPLAEPYIPVEFAVAAYRFGHSMVRDEYHINTFLRDEIGVGPFALFGDEDLPANDLTNLNGFRRLPDDWGFDWRLFFDLDPAETPQPSLAIDPSLADPLGGLPTSVAGDPPLSLARRNLERGVRLGLPSGIHVARAMGITPLTAAELELDGVADELRAHPPLWYYVLKEAQQVCGGTHLGPVGGRIVAEVLVGLLAGDPLSYLGVEPGWRPAAPFTGADGTFGMADLIRFAEAGSPLPGQAAASPAAASPASASRP